MSDQAVVHEARGRRHPGARTYLIVAAVLLVITIGEVSVFYLPAMHPIMVPSLLVLAVAKFSLVAMFYMHLKSDSRVFSWLFVAPLAVAVTIIVALMLLFRVI